VKFAPHTIRSRFAARPLINLVDHVNTGPHLRRPVPGFVRFFCGELKQGTASPGPVRGIPSLRFVIRAKSDKIPWFVIDLHETLASVIVLL
jgi:hypothetical protein